MLRSFKSVLFLCLSILSHAPIPLASVCDLKPRGSVGFPKDVGTRYRIAIANNPEKYVPGVTYNVILQGRSSVVEEPNAFNGFTLSVEAVEKSDELLAMGPLAAGTFKLLPHEKNTKIDETCPNTIVHTSLTFVTNVEVLWIAPNPGIGCVRFRAAVMEQHIWYKDGGGLTLELCEVEAFESMDVPEKCRSCNEAKYEMKFEGLWTRQSHPRFYPDNSWLTRFSDVIGASHAFGYRFWKTNETASPGLIEFSEKENTTLLESEIKSNKTRTVIKAKGIGHPNITGKTFAVFRVDPEHHLLSIISLIRPSPDWFVGISGLALCDHDGNWTAQKTLDLYPYDLGLWGDLKYESKSIPTEQPIHRIDHYNISESPFFTNSEEKLKPLARVYLIKSREYDRHCQPSTEENENVNRPAGGGDFIQGKEASSRMPEMTEAYYVPRNDRFNPERPRPEVPEQVLDKECDEAPFSSEYSDCSIPQCDVDRVKIEYRHFDDRIREHCTQINATTERLVECKRNCSGGKEPTLRSTLVKCAVTPWPSYFSPCDPDRCSRNRTRHATDPAKKNDPECLSIQWYQVIKCQPRECQGG